MMLLCLQTSEVADVDNEEPLKLPSMKLMSDMLGPAETVSLLMFLMNLCIVWINIMFCVCHSTTTQIGSVLLYFVGTGPSRPVACLVPRWH